MDNIKKNIEQEGNTSTSPASNTPIILRWLENALKLEHKYGFFNIIKSIFIIGLCVLLSYIVINPENFIKAISQLKEKEHKEMVDRRLSIEPELRMIIKDLRIITKASRAYICEFHNGTNNLNGMPFLYADMRYEDVADSVVNVDYDYQNQPLSRFPLASIMFKDRYWYGSIDELITIDERLGTRLKFNNVKWAAFIMLDGNLQEIGILGVSYSEIPSIEMQEKIGREIRNAALKISILLGDEINNSR